MSGRSADSLPSHGNLLAIALCLLALLFAFEAKTEWYAPGGNPGGNVSAAKALPVSTPELVEHGIPSPDPEHPALAFAGLPSPIAIWAPRFNAPLFSDGQPNALPSSSALQLSPSNFFRPPPSA